MPKCQFHEKPREKFRKFSQRRGDIPPQQATTADRCPEKRPPSESERATRCHRAREVALSPQRPLPPSPLFPAAVCTREIIKRLSRLVIPSASSGRDAEIPAERARSSALLFSPPLARRRGNIPATSPILIQSHDFLAEEIPPLEMASPDIRPPT